MDEDLHDLILLYYNYKEYNQYFLEQIFYKIQSESLASLEYLSQCIQSNKYNVYDLFNSDDRYIFEYYIDFCIYMKKNDNDINKIISINDRMINVKSIILYDHCTFYFNYSVAKLLDNENLFESIKIYYDINKMYILSYNYVHEISLFLVKNISYLSSSEILVLLNNIKNFYTDFDYVYWSAIIIFFIKTYENLQDFQKLYCFVKNFTYMSKCIKQYLKVVIVEYLIRQIISTKNYDDIDIIIFDSFDKHKIRLKYLFSCFKYLKNKNHCILQKTNYLKNYENSCYILECDKFLTFYYLQHINFNNHNLTCINESLIMFDY